MKWISLINSQFKKFQNRENGSVIKKPLLIVITMLLFFAALGFGVRAYSRRAISGESQPEAPVVPPPSMPTVQSGSSDDVDGTVAVLYRNGFEPREITRSKGHFILVVLNRCGLSELSLRLDREAGTRLREASFSREKREWTDVVNLPPGNYILSEASNPDWTCKITITP
jgi:hypothetical protein